MCVCVWWGQVLEEYMAALKSTIVSLALVCVRDTHMRFPCLPPFDILWKPDFVT